MRTREPLDLDEARKRIAKGRPVLVEDIDIAVSTIHGRQFVFAQDRLADPIQRSHRVGKFYEPQELATIKAHFPQGGTFVDIGSNIGNHSLFVAAFCQPERIIPFEPNPLAYKLLLANIMLNGFQDLFDLRHLGLGLSDSAEEGFAMSDQRKNLGGARMEAGGGDIATITGDEALQGITPSFIKIDVEGMEMKALMGLEQTFLRALPTVLIEVDRANYAAFEAWAEALGYETLETFQHRRANRNYLIKHPKTAESG